MRRTDGLVKILDFGIAKLMEQPTSGLSSEASTMLRAQTEVGYGDGNGRLHVAGAGARPCG